MGGDAPDDGAIRSREIEKIIKQDEKRISKEVKLLLLGEIHNQISTTEMRRHISNTLEMHEK